MAATSAAVRSRGVSLVAFSEVQGGGFVVIAQSFFHESSNLELDRSLRRHLDRFERLGVLRLAGAAVFDLEDAEVAELEPVAPAKLHDDVVEESLDDLFD